MAKDIEHILSIFDVGGQEQFKFLYKNKEGDASNLIKDSNLIALIIDPKRYARSLEYVYSIIPLIENYNKIYVSTKNDLIDDELNYNLDTLEPFIDDKIIRISSKTGENIGALLEKIEGIVSKQGNYSERNENTRFSKVIFAGLGGAGKTSIYNRLKNNEFSKTELTVGISSKTIHIHYQE
jgi:GTPase SAR1 family protein